jgi:sugar lactone lactonase YvrE
MRGWLVVFAACLVAADDAPVPRWRALNQSAREAVQAKDYAKLRGLLMELRPLIPGNPRIAYNLAAAEARLGNSAAALAALRDWAGMRLVYDVAADDDFSSLRAMPEFAAIVKQIDENKKPVSHAAAAFTLPARDIIPEDIAYDPKTRRFFISSVRKGTIVTGDGKTFARSDWSILALRVDVRRRRLWAATGWIPHCESCVEADKDKTALLAFDLQSGTLQQRIESPVKGLLGDMTISRGGDLYISEGIYGAVFHLPAAAREFVRLDTPGEFPSPQTPALSADEKTLYIPDYLRGIAAMDLATRSVKWLQPGRDIALSGIDGLYVYHDRFLAVQNGTSPPRIMRFSLDLEKQEVLEANWLGLGEPTHGTIVGTDFYFLASTGWNDYDDNGKKKQGTDPVESSVRKIDLKK